MIKSLIFDFDGTLADSKAMLIELYNRIAGRYHFKMLDPADFDYYKSLSIRQCCTNLGIPIHKVPMLISAFLKGYTQSVQKLEPFRGIPEMLHQLKDSGFSLAIVSSNQGKNITRFLADHHLEGFSSISCSGELSGKGRLIRRYLKKNHLNTDQAMYIGDEKRDIRASRKSGIKVIWVSWGFDHYDEVRSAHPDYVARKPEDILRIAETARAKV
jgi:phosphoglycolate phosphatase